MADALISASVGASMWAATAAMGIHCSRKLKAEQDERKAPLMGVLGAFIFSAQMINFAIPGTGSSGHIGGAMILAILLGPHAAFLTLASVLTVQALFFADGGLLALGCNTFNMAFLPCFVAYPLVYRPIVGSNPTPGRLLTGATLASIIGLQLGSFGVVLQTVFSGISDLPFATFATVMQPIHLAIGLVEGLITFGVVSLIWKARPEILNSAKTAKPIKTAIIGLAVATVMIAAILSAFASSQPDGLEWSIAKTAGHEEAAKLTAVQEKSAILPDYGFQKPLSKYDTSIAGLIGALVTLTAVSLIGVALRKRARKINA